MGAKLRNSIIYTRLNDSFIKNRDNFRVFHEPLIFYQIEHETGLTENILWVGNKNKSSVKSFLFDMIISENF